MMVCLMRVEGKPMVAGPHQNPCAIEWVRSSHLLLHDRTSPYREVFKASVAKRKQTRRRADACECEPLGDMRQGHLRPACRRLGLWQGHHALSGGMVDLNTCVFGYTVSC